MKWDINPFQELYLSESLEADAFVELFSPVPLTSMIRPLFQKGHVVLSGTQGSGKTMLLQLLLPETREAYFDKGIPMPDVLREARILSAGVNLVRSALCEIGQVTLGKDEEYDYANLPYYFADFFNYWVIQDLLRNVKRVAKRPEVFNAIVNLEHEHRFVASLAAQDCWFGYLAGCVSLEDILEKVGTRIALYRRWANLNTLNHLVPAELMTTKTAIGEPIARTVECLMEAGVLDRKADVFIRVDQLEELHQQAAPHQQRLRMRFRWMLNRAFAYRDGRIHYRIGTRRYAWSQVHADQLTVHGSGARLETRRDYLPIDIDDDLFVRKENRSGWLFPVFAADAFCRRVKYFSELSELPKPEFFEQVFGISPKPKQRAEQFAPKRTRDEDVDRILRITQEDDGEAWTEEWKEWLRAMYRESPLVGVLAAAWGRQTGGRGVEKQNRRGPVPKEPKWMKPWWAKERQMQGVLQLAARRAQRLLWWGSRDVVDLGGGNITAFMQICHSTWDLFLKAESLKPEAQRINLLMGGMFPIETQAVGIQNASRLWRDKLKEQPGGDVRQRFIDELGRTFRQQLRNDLAMSYPGANGFSLCKDDWDDPANRELRRFLVDAVGYGDLVATEHTTKNKQGEARIKFYLAQLLSPVFQIPVAHTKEPLYWEIEDVMKIAKAAKLPFALEPAARGEGQTRPPRDPNQLTLL